MAKETEIKLRVTPAGLQALQAHSLLNQRGVSPWQERTLLNAYQDTPAAELAKSQVALRIRRDGDILIQTLKTRGASVAGLSERNEWDWYLQQEQLDTVLLDDSCWPQELSVLDKSQLGEIFRTDFVRISRDLEWQHDGQQVQVEVALDQGRVLTAEAGEEAICELELELRAGPVDALLQLALELARDIPMMPCDISKAERGYRLLQADNFALHAGQEQLVEEQTIEEAFVILAHQRLAASQRLAEQYRHTGQWSLLQAWVRQLAELRALLSSLGQLVPRKSSHALRQALDALLDDWQPVLRGAEEREQRDAAQARFVAELEQVRWGVFSLDMALWLHTRDWSRQRNDRLERQASAPLVRWLLRYLQAECQAVNLENYRLQPLALDDQLPRFERILVWLESARHLIPAEGMDELLGLLRALRQAAVSRDEPVIVDHLRRTLSSRGWKALLRAAV